MKAIGKFFRDHGLYTMIANNSIHTNPPLCITEEQLDEGFAIIDAGLDIADQAVERLADGDARRRPRRPRRIADARAPAAAAAGGAGARRILGSLRRRRRRDRRLGGREVPRRATRGEPRLAARLPDRPRNPPFRWPFANDLNLPHSGTSPSTFVEPWQRERRHDRRTDSCSSRALHVARGGLVGFLLGALIGLGLATIFVHSRCARAGRSSRTSSPARRSRSSPSPR